MANSEVAGVKEKVLGPVVAVERTYRIDVQALKDACQLLGDETKSTTAVCYVEKFKHNGTEKGFGEPDEFNLTRDNFTLHILATPNGYLATVSKEAKAEGDALNLYEVKGFLEQASKDGGLSNVELTSHAQLVR